MIKIAFPIEWEARQSTEVFVGRKDEDGDFDALRSRAMFKVPVKWSVTHYFPLQERGRFVHVNKRGDVARIVENAETVTELTPDMVKADDHQGLSCFWSFAIRTAKEKGVIQ